MCVSLQFVPLIVELCTRIVEVRGLDIVGVYRVPGNSVAVSHMQEELNRGIENMNMDNDKWLDVNVVSSLLKAFFRKLPHPLVPPGKALCSRQFTGTQHLLHANHCEQIDNHTMLILSLISELL